MIIQFYRTAVGEDLAEDVGGKIGLGDHVTAFTGGALFGQLVKFWGQMAQHAALHVLAKQNEVLLQQSRALSRVPADCKLIHLRVACGLPSDYT